MNRTTAPGSVTGQYVDEDPESEIQGTLLVAADRNAIQEELIALIVAAGITPSADTLTQVRDAVAARISQIMTASEILTRLLTIDGAGSGLDADLLDGVQITGLARSDSPANVIKFRNDSGELGATIDATDLGLLMRSRISYSGDINAIGVTGIYAIATGATNTPSGAGVLGASLLHIQWDSNAKRQMYFDATTSTAWIRVYTGGAWGSWAKQWSDLNDGTGSGLDADLVRGTTPGAGGLVALAKSGTIWAADNDGAGSGLDADLLDGLHGSAYMPKTGGDFSGAVGFDSGEIRVGGLAGIYRKFRFDGTISSDGTNYNSLWHAGNDGAGSGLDADLLDGKHATSFSTAESVQTTGGARTHTIGAMAVGEVKTLAIDLQNTSGGSVTIAINLPSGGTYSYSVTTPGQFVVGTQQSAVAPAHAYGTAIAGGETLYTATVNTSNSLQAHGIITRVS